MTKDERTHSPPLPESSATPAAADRAVLVAKKRVTTKQGVIIAAGLALILGGVVATGAHGPPGSQSQSYKDGVKTADHVAGDSTSNPDGYSNAISDAIINGCNPASGSCRFASGDGSGGRYANAFCSVYVDQMPSGGNRPEWMQGCIAEYEHDVSDYMHFSFPGVGGSALPPTTTTMPAVPQTTSTTTTTTVPLTPTQQKFASDVENQFPTVGTAEASANAGEILCTGLTSIGPTALGSPTGAFDDLVTLFSAGSVQGSNATAVSLPAAGVNSAGILALAVQDVCPQYTSWIPTDLNAA